VTARLLTAEEPWWWTADTEDDDNWLSEFGGDDIRALVRERNRLLATLDARSVDVLIERVKAMPPNGVISRWENVSRSAVIDLLLQARCRPDTDRPEPLS
jgi:hypothetical protein